LEEARPVVCITSPLPSLGESIDGRYVIERQLGHGGMGVVYAARHALLGGRVAIKMMIHAEEQPKAAARRLFAEARVTHRLKSDHAVRLLDLGVWRGLPYIVMEYLEGEDLACALQRAGPFSVAEAVDVVVEACDALAQAHALGIVHRDLKPANLFRERRPGGYTTTKVLDFGISKAPAFLRNGTTLTNYERKIIGSPHYMAPEQLRNPREVDARADVWSLGVILFELLAGVVPFAGTTLGEVVAAIMTDGAPRLDAYRHDCPPALVALVAACLAHRREDRPPSVTSLALALAPYGSTRSAVVAERAGAPRDRPSIPESPPSSPDLAVTLDRKLPNILWRHTTPAEMLVAIASSVLVASLVMAAAAWGLTR
jgi:serine/threonine-protein kinase